MQKLSKYLGDKQLTFKAFGARVGVAGYTVERWCRGDFIPKPAMLHAISKETKGAIVPADWFERPKRR